MELFTRPHPKLADLSEDEFEDLLELYYDYSEQKLTVQELIDLFEIDTQPSRLYKLLPQRIRIDAPCTYCGRPMLQPALSRTAAGSSKKPDLICPSCDHKTGSWCWCTKCKTARKERKSQDAGRRKPHHRRHQPRRHVETRRDQRAILHERLALERFPSPADSELTFRERVLLSALLRAGLNEDNQTVQPLDLHETPICPTPAQCIESVRELSQKRAIVAHPESEIDAFIFDDDGGFRYYLHTVAWNLNVTDSHPHPRGQSEFIECLWSPHPIGEWDFEAGAELWRELAVGELLQYLEFKLQEKTFPTQKALERAKTIFPELLNRLSSAQLTYFVWRVTAQAADR